jgi:hypothetical protein
VKVIVCTLPNGRTRICRPVPWARKIKSVDGAIVDPPQPIDILLFRAVSREEFESVKVEFAETEDEFIARIIAKDIPKNARNIRVVDENEIPQDRSKRDNLTHELTFRERAK